MAIRIQARRDPESIPREITLEHVVAGDVEDAVLCRCHVEASVAQRVELPISSAVAMRHQFCDVVYDRFQF
jgi:hypothetical protein